MHRTETKAEIIHGDCRAAMLDLWLDGVEVDAVVTDPPYHLTTGKKGGTGVASLNVNSPAGRSRISTGFMGKEWDGGDIAFDKTTWELAFNVLKPGGYLLAFSAPRTVHRMACAIEDAGFEIRDRLVQFVSEDEQWADFLACLTVDQADRLLSLIGRQPELFWCFGTGFPKSLDVSKALDKMAGAEREVIGTRADFARDGSNRKTDGSHTRPHAHQGGHGFDDRWGQPVTTPATDAAGVWAGYGTALKPAYEPIILARKPLIGTVAENVLTWGTGALNIDCCRIGTFANTTPSGANRYNAKLAEMGYRPGSYEQEVNPPEPKEGRWPANVLTDGSDEVLLAFPSAPGQQGRLTGNEPSAKTDAVYGEYAGRAPSQPRSDTGSAARFFYQAKASTKDRSGSRHPTVKPLALMRYLCRLVTPPGGLVLDPFAGSGSTLQAAVEEGFRTIGIEREAEYIEDIKRRLGLTETEEDALLKELLA